MIFSDVDIETRDIIHPFEKQQKRAGKISYGVSSYGYDLRLGRRFKLFKIDHGEKPYIDPKNALYDDFDHIEDAEHIIIPPNSFALGETVEYVKMPRDCLGICIGKSTYARCGIIVNVTPIEPEWEGKITIEISNTTPLPVKVYADEGIAQLIFIGCNTICQRSYKDKGGKYQNQTGVTLPRID